MATELYWIIDDEPGQREYRVRIRYHVDSFDSGDSQTPPQGGEVFLEGLDIALVRHFNEHGNVSGVDSGAAAEKYTDRAWQVLQQDEFLRERIEEACRQEGYQGLSPRGVLDGSSW
jgi:hypothetical protein